jgi:signal transduction histidine kinase
VDSQAPPGESATAAALRGAVDASCTIIALYDPDDWLVYANRAYHDTFLKGHAGPIRFPDILRLGFAGNFGVKINSGDIEAFLQDILPRRRAVPSRSIETDTVDGRWLWITETVLPDGSLLSVGSDITRLKHSEKTLRQAHESALALTRRLDDKARELERSNAELDQFASVASHDLQEPLRTIASYAQLLERRRDAAPEQVHEYVGIIVDGVHRMQRLIGDLLAYSRVSAGPVAVEPVSVEAAVQEALANLEGAIRGKQARVVSGPLPPMPADASQLTQLFQNLVGNALKFCDAAQPEVRIDAQRVGGNWVFGVHDNGIGIDPKHFGRLFTLFQRLNPRERFEGTGMGLAICRKIVARHGGRIWVESAGPGRGTTFRFTLAPDAQAAR